ncbi:MAG: hypothetical protein MK066_14525 [Crocinitomicaceae bacterium]|nr:hypothetical protein [Crocinitomicaceae bacterium]
MLNHKGTPKEITEIVYDFEDGKKTDYDNGRREQYDSLGWLAKVSHSRIEGEFSSSILYEYDSNGFLITEYSDSITPSKLVLKYEYPDSNRYLQVSWFQSRPGSGEFVKKSLKYYNENYRPSHEKDIALDSYYSSGNVLFEYNMEGEISRRTYIKHTKSGVEEIPSDSSVSIYKNGNIISRISYAKGKPTYIRKYEYLEFDDSGNWTYAKSTTDYVGTTIRYNSVHEREIDYY